MVIFEENPTTAHSHFGHQSINFKFFPCQPAKTFFANQTHSHTCRPTHRLDPLDLARFTSRCICKKAAKPVHIYPSSRSITIYYDIGKRWKNSPTATISPHSLAAAAAIPSRHNGKKEAEKNSHLIKFHFPRAFLVACWLVDGGRRPFFHKTDANNQPLRNFVSVFACVCVCTKTKHLFKKRTSVERTWFVCDKHKKRTKGKLFHHHNSHTHILLHVMWP